MRLVCKYIINEYNYNNIIYISFTYMRLYIYYMKTFCCPGRISIYTINEVWSLVCLTTSICSLSNHKIIGTKPVFSDVRL